MQKTLSLFFLIFLLQSFHSQVNENSIIGKWMAVDKSVEVQIYRVEQEYHAKVLWFNDKLGSGTPMNLRMDSKNPNPALRTRKIIGMEVLSGLRYNAKDRKWENGKIYEGMSGRTWDSSAYLAENGELKVRGYWKFEWIGKSIAFRRVN